MKPFLLSFTLAFLAGMLAAPLAAQAPENEPPLPAPSAAPSAAPESAAPSETTVETQPAPAAEAEAPSEPAPAPAPSADEPEEFSQKTLPPPPSPKPRVIPSRHGQTTGETWIGHRAVIERYAGWGWIKKEREPWSRARWVMIEEEPGQRMAPGRFHPRPTLDDNTQYRLYGSLADYQGYEPNFDVFVDVFRIEGWETLGPAERPALKPPRSASSSQGRWAERGANLRR